MTDKKTIAALNRLTDQLARIAAAVEGGTTYTPRHAATLTPTYAIDDSTGGDTWNDVVDSPKVWTFEDLESLPIGWTVRDRDGDPWEKAGYRGDGTSMWRPGDSDSLPRSSEALMRWMNPVNVAGMTVEELRAADNGTRVVDSLNDTWRKEGDEFVHVQWPSASPVTPKTLHQYGPILEATR